MLLYAHSKYVSSCYISITNPPVTLPINFRLTPDAKGLNRLYK